MFVGVIITTALTNRVYEIFAVNSDVESETGVKASVYSLVANSLANGGVSGTAYNADNWIDVTQVKEAANVIAAGGITITGGDLAKTKITSRAYAPQGRRKAALFVRRNDRYKK
ncbi:MAG: hypothetical protein J1F63_10180 [Oscillospiraceae bacterium]|nr:hypothetical protein [Oscillospiraceae bacterium]